MSGRSPAERRHRPLLEHELGRDRLAKLELALLHARLVRGVVDRLQGPVPAVDDLEGRADDRVRVVPPGRQRSWVIAYVPIASPGARVSAPLKLSPGSSEPLGTL